MLCLIILGICTYAKKAINAQLSGAYAVIVAHDDPDVDIENIIPYAKGHNTEINLPIILVSKRSSDIIYDYQKNNEDDIILEFSVEVDGEKSKVVNSEFWINTADPDSYKNFLKMENIQKNFGDKLEFSPKYKFQNLIDKDNTENFIFKHCYAHGRFCQVENAEIGPLAAIQEALRQICIWKSERIGKEIYWQYVNKYVICLKSMMYNIAGKLNCYEDIYSDLGLERDTIDSIERCAGKETHQNDMSTTQLLIENENEFIYSDIYLVPAFLINGQILKEELSDKSIITGICDKLEETPEYCNQFIISSNQTFSNSNQKVHDTMVGLLILALLGLFIIVIIIYVFFRSQMNRNVDKDIYNQVNEYVSSYMKIQN